MQLTSKTPGLDEKLDGLLSLLTRWYSNMSLPSGWQTFMCADGEFFGEDLHNLQEILFEDGLVRCFVSPN